MKHAMEIIIKDPNGLKGYQTIGLAEASKLLNIPRYDVLKLWNKHNLPILKLSGSKQSAVRLYKYDFMSIQVALQKNYTDNVKKRRRSSPTP